MPMTDKELTEIFNERISEWRDRVISLHSTPIILLAVGHDDLSGQFVLCIPKGFTDPQIAAMLEKAIDLLE
ncbi:hypothetical protein LCGC14_0817710 [marine sediment metagenome]|uniref:Uncharacterized protein n=1 Tax=marine sediment metagenome TaxID=412755 RepID=A0A0F9Q542_9ZZZZ